MYVWKKYWSIRSKTLLLLIHLDYLGMSWRVLEISAKERSALAYWANLASWYYCWAEEEDNNNIYSAVTSTTIIAKTWQLTPKQTGGRKDINVLEWTVPLGLENVQQNVSASALFAQFPPDSCTRINAYVYKCMWPFIPWSCSYLGIHPLSLLRLTKLWADVPKLLRVVVGRRCPRACWVNPAEEPLVVQNKICTWERERERERGTTHTHRSNVSSWMTQVHICYHHDPAQHILVKLSDTGKQVYLQSRGHGLEKVPT